MLAESSEISSYTDYFKSTTGQPDTGGKIVGPVNPNEVTNSIANLADNSFILVYKDKNNNAQSVSFKTETELYKWLSKQGYGSGWGFLTTWQGWVVVAAAGLAGWALSEYVL